MLESMSAGWKVAGVLIHGIAGGGMFFGIYRMITMGMRMRWVQTGWKYLLEQTQQTRQRREVQYQKAYEEIGLQEKVPWIQRWDQCYSQSMIQQKYLFLNSQLYISLVLFAASVLGVITLVLLCKTPLAGIGAGAGVFALVLFGGVFYVSLLRRQKWRQTEKELMPFLNIVDNFSKTEQDLFRIFEMATPYLKEPLRSALAECGRHAAATGNRSEAIRDLIYRIEHPKFREMIQNLEICSRNEANYTQILGEVRDSLSAYMSNRKEEAGIFKEGQVQILVIVCMGIPMIAMLTAITQIPLRGMVDTMFGRCILLYWVILFCVIIYQMFLADTGKER